MTISVVGRSTYHNVSMDVDLWHKKAGDDETIFLVPGFFKQTHVFVIFPTYIAVALLDSARISLLLVHYEIWPSRITRPSFGLRPPIHLHNSFAVLKRSSVCETCTDCFDDNYSAQRGPAHSILVGKAFSPTAGVNPCTRAPTRLSFAAFLHRPIGSTPLGRTYSFCC